jgi:hypothetical protein
VAQRFGIHTSVIGKKPQKIKTISGKKAPNLVALHRAVWRIPEAVFIPPQLKNRNRRFKFAAVQIRPTCCCCCCKIL